MTGKEAWKKSFDTDRMNSMIHFSSFYYEQTQIIHIFAYLRLKLSIPYNRLKVISRVIEHLHFGFDSSRTSLCLGSIRRQRIIPTF